MTVNISTEIFQSIKDQRKPSEAFIGQAETQNLLNKIAYSFNDIELLLRSFSHQSFVNENTNLKLQNYERLEHLGDSVLGLLITEEIFKRYPKEAEGNLSKLKSMLVNGRSFSKLALNLGLDKLVLLGKGELAHTGFQNESILGDVFESFVGALYLDGGIELAKKVLLISIEDSNAFFNIEKIDSGNYKTRLQELTHAKLNTSPEYKSQTIEKDGVSGFEVKLTVLGKNIVTIWNPSKKTAMNEAAKIAINQNLIHNLTGDQNAH